MQPPRLLGRKRRTDDARGVADDEGHLLGRAQRGRDEEVAFVLAVVVIADHHDSSGGKSRADLNTLDGIDAHQSRGEITVELAVNRRTETNGYAFRDNLDDRSDGGAALANVVEVALEELCLLRIRTEERVALDLVPVPPRALDAVFAHLDQRAAYRKARHDFARDRARSNPHGGLARGLTPPAAIIAYAVFGIVGVIGVPGPVLVFDLGIILRALVDILDDERNRRSRGHLLAGRFVAKDAGEDFHLVRLVALRRETRLTGPPLVEIRLDVRLGQRDARRATVDHPTGSEAQAFAKRCDPYKVTESVERHRVPLEACGSPRGCRGQIPAPGMRKRRSRRL